MSSENKIVPVSRIEWVDYTKGMAMILVILAHTVCQSTMGSFVRGYIFSFHMPLFFILSGFTFRFSSTFEEWKQRAISSAKKLLFPAVTLYLILTASECLKHPINLFSYTFWQSRVDAFLFESAMKFDFYGRTVESVGILWFFFAMYFGKILFDFLHLELKESRLLVLVSFFSGLIGVLYGVSGYWMLFSADIVFAIIPFFCVGYFLREYQYLLLTKNFVWKLFAFWVVSVYLMFPEAKSWSYLEIAIRKYPMFPLCYLTAVAGSICFCYFCRFVRSNNKFVHFLDFVGKNSLHLLCIHAVDDLYDFAWRIPGYEFVSFGVRIILDLVIFFVLALMQNRKNI